ncbi:hypothetical protein FRC08_018543 [Ceratobasidium sp. 394]|nr:hypothetical protein FRC08_018543 [Ceratobasidium sp. 394]
MRKTPGIEAITKAEEDVIAGDTDIKWRLAGPPELDAEADALALQPSILVRNHSKV